jgi:hypothetical protein
MARYTDRDGDTWTEIVLLQPDDGGQARTRDEVENKWGPLTPDTTPLTADTDH